MAIVLQKPSFIGRIAPIFRGFDPLLILAVCLLMGIGLITMYSAGYDYGAGNRFSDQSRNVLFACGIMFVLAQVSPQQLMRIAVPLYTVGVALLIAVAIFGITKKGARRWVNIGVVIQPSEILKIAVPLMLAWWFQRREGQLRPLDFAVATVLLAVPVGLIIKQPDLGTALLVLMAGLAVLFFAGLSWKLVAPPVLAIVIAVGVLVGFESKLCADEFSWHVVRNYQKQRVCTLMDPTKDPLGKGFHVIQSMVAIGAGGVKGKGFMQGTQTHLDFIPERTTDFVFAAYAEEFGLVGNISLIVLFIFLIFRALAIAQKAVTLFARLLGGAVGMSLFTYAFVNMGMVSGILPVVGVPLPFISYGGTAMITLGLTLGILMSIARAYKTS
ncbi:MAG: rod shape-determining protein RodA [Burkholderiaceae bacterium]|jgi:rod shape determining protein RodA|nr:rod shape-determining protein RodA [Burkholderiaceae bacterium]